MNSKNEFLGHPWYKRRMWKGGRMDKEVKMALVVLLSNKEQTLFCLLLRLLVISKEILKIPFLQPQNGKTYNPGCWPQKTPYFQKTFFFSEIWLAELMKKQRIQHKKMKTGKCAVTARKLWFVEVFEEFLCVFLSTQTSTSALLTAPVTISVSTLPAVSSASVTKATSSTASRTVEVSLNLSSVAWL